MSNTLLNNQSNNNQSNNKKYCIDVIKKNFYNSSYKQNARMLYITETSDKEHFHILDAVMLDVNKVKVFSSVLLNITDAKHNVSKCAQEQRKEYYTCSLDNFLNCISSKYELSDTEVSTYRSQLEACYK